MKLYFAPGACSLSPHIVLEELGLPYEAVRVDLRAKRTAADEDFNELCPKGYVPLLFLDDGAKLTEGVAIVQYLADLRPEAGLAPPLGSFERVRLWETLAYLSSEVHKNLGGLFGSAPEEVKEQRRALSRRRLGFLDAQLEGRAFLMGASFTVADAYLFTLLRWCPSLGIPREEFPRLAEYFARLADRPAVQRAMSAEGLH